MANRFDLNNRTSRLKVTVAGFDQFDALAVAVVVVRFFVYLIAAAFIHDYNEKFVIAAAFMEIVCMAFMLIQTFKRDILASIGLRLLGQVMLAGAAIGVIYVNGIISTYLKDVQKRESVIVLLVIFNILFVVVEAAVALMSLDVFLAASTSKHRRSRSGEFKTRIKPITALIGTGLCFLLLALPAVFAGSLVSGLDNVKIESKVYQVAQSEYVYYKYPATARKRNSKSVLIYDDDSEIALSDSPLYFGGDGKTEKIMLSKAYAIVEPSISSTKKVDTLSMIEEVREGTYAVTSEEREREATNFFLYDGGDSYVFFDELTMHVGDNELTVSPYSFVTAKYNGSITIFDPRNSSILTYSLIGKDASVNLKDGTVLDVVTDLLVKTDGSEKMLVLQPSGLDEFVG